MKKKYWIIIGVVIAAVIILSSGLYYFGAFDSGPTEDPSKVQGDDVAYDTQKDLSIQEYNIQQRKKYNKKRTDCDTIALMEHILNKYPDGTYLMMEDVATTNPLPNAAVIYQKDAQGDIVYALIVKSRKDSVNQRVVDIKNLTGYDASFTDLDSTRLGLGLFFVDAFRCKGNDFQLLWSKELPSHGGFYKMEMQKWAPKNVPYIRVRFLDAIRGGHVDYNLFQTNGVDSIPHLIQNYENLRQKNRMVAGNDDKIPDFYEYVYIYKESYETLQQITLIDSILYLWKDTAYINTRNPKYFRYF